MTLHYTFFFVGWLLLVLDAPFLAIWIDPALRERMPPIGLLLSAHTVAPIIAVAALVLAAFAWHGSDAGERRYAVNTVLLTVALFLLYPLQYLIGIILPAIGSGLEAYTAVVVIAVCTVVVITVGLIVKS